LQKSELAVGDSTQLEIIFSTKQYRNQVSKSPMISTNEGPPARKVTIKASIVQNPESTYPIVISPFRIDVSKFGDIEDRTETKFNIANVSKEDLEISLVAKPDGVFEVDLPKMVKAGQAVDGTIKVDDEYLDQEFERSLTLELNDTNNTRFTIPVRRMIRAPQKPATQTSGASGAGGSGK
jgi:hypothetical protein